MENTATRVRVKPDIDELSLLYDINRVLDRSLELKEVADPILDLLVARTDLRRAMLTLFNRATGEITIEAAHGLSDDAKDRVTYKPGEGITGAVVETGKPIVVPHVQRDPRFLGRTGAASAFPGEDLAFLCVPIKIGDNVAGTFGGYSRYEGEEKLKDERRLLTVIASMIAEAVKLRQAIAEERQQLRAENERLQQELRERFRPDNIVGTSQVMQGVYDMIHRVAPSDATALITGESGTGKELVAHAIHHNSRRAGMPYIKVNCAALPETVLESELFGHERGAFTGALSRKKGRFELAQGGTIFLDEVGDLTPATQVKLLRVLQEREFDRVGGTETLRADVRVIAATNRNLEAMVEEGEFREDLFYRLNVFPIHMPPLRKRKSDIMLLVDHFIQKYARELGKDVRRVSTPAIDMMMAYHWPGNVRELENCIERAVLLTTDQVIHGHHLPPSLQTAETTDTAPRGTLQEAVESVERELIQEALKASRGNCAKAAQDLGITERVMGLRLRKYNIEYRRFRGHFQ